LRCGIGGGEGGVRCKVENFAYFASQVTPKLNLREQGYCTWLTISRV